MRSAAANLTGLLATVVVAVLLTAAPALAAEEAVEGIQSADELQGVIVALILGVVVGAAAFAASRRQAGGRTGAEPHGETAEGTP